MSGTASTSADEMCVAPRENGCDCAQPRLAKLPGQQLRADEALAALVEVRLRQEHEVARGAVVWFLQEGADRVVVLRVLGSLGPRELVE